MILHQSEIRTIIEEKQKNVERLRSVGVLKHHIRRLITVTKMGPNTLNQETCSKMPLHRTIQYMQTLAHTHARAHTHTVDVEP